MESIFDMDSEHKQPVEQKKNTSGNLMDDDIFGSMASGQTNQQTSNPNNDPLGGFSFVNF